MRLTKRSKDVSTTAASVCKTGLRTRSKSDLLAHYPDISHNGSAEIAKIKVKERKVRESAPKAIIKPWEAYSNKELKTAIVDLKSSEKAVLACRPHETLNWDDAGCSFSEGVILDLISAEKEKGRLLSSNLMAFLAAPNIETDSQGCPEAVSIHEKKYQAFLERRELFGRLKAIITSSRQSNHYLSMTSPADRATERLRREKAQVLDSIPVEESQIRYAQQNANDNIKELLRTLQVHVLRNQTRILGSDFEKSAIRCSIVEKPWEMRLLNSVGHRDEKRVVDVLQREASK